MPDVPWIHDSWSMCLLEVTQVCKVVALLHRCAGCSGSGLLQTLLWAQYWHLMWVANKDMEEITYINTFCYEVNYVHYSTCACILFQWAIYIYIHVQCFCTFMYTVVYMCMCKIMCIVNVVVILCMCYMLVAEFTSTCWLVHVHVPDAFMCTTTNYDRIWPYLFSWREEKVTSKHYWRMRIRQSCLQTLGRL